MTKPPHSPPDEHPKGQTHSTVDQEPQPRLPHEHDQSSDSQESPSQPVIEQASKDLKKGLVDTDRGPAAHDAYQKQKRGS